MSGILKQFRDPSRIRMIGERLKKLIVPRPYTFMEVCGTHTMAIRRSGIHSLLPDNVRLISGPGCPVCVTPERYLDTACAMARQHHVVLATFGDMVRVPGSYGSLSSLRAEGADIKVVYSPDGALDHAREHPECNVVFLAVGFETTAPAVAATLLRARELKLGNYFILSGHKRVIPALAAIGDDPQLSVDGFILPGHVSAIIGSEPYRFIAESLNRACVITGFEPADILLALIMLIKQCETRDYHVAIQYSRAVRQYGNLRALDLMDTVFEPAASVWRGFGLIQESGLVLRESFRHFDALARFPVEVSAAIESAACRCGDVLKGIITPEECALFGRECKPLTPVGPCMVSSEGSCAAYYKYTLTPEFHMRG